MRFVLIALLLVASSAEAGRGTALFKYLPDDASVVLAADIAHVRGTATFKAGWKLARDRSPELDALATNVAVDKLVDTVVVGATQDKQHTVIVVEGRVDKLLAEAKKNATKN